MGLRKANNTNLKLNSMSDKNLINGFLNEYKEVISIFPALNTAELIDDYLALIKSKRNNNKVCPRCNTNDEKIKPVVYKCHNCGASWQTE